MDNEETEQWLRYPHNKDYAVSSWGKIVKLKSSPKSPKRLLHIKLPLNGNPLFCSVLSSYVGAVVLETFTGPKPLLCVVGYKDGDKQNNKLSNLYWKEKGKNAESVTD